MRRFGIEASRIVDCHAPFPIWLLNASAVRGEGALEMLARGERDRANRFHSARSRARYIAAHAALRLLVERYFGIPDHRQVYEISNLGKPHLVDFPQVQCSLSYSGDRALVATAPAREIGVDIEHVREIEDIAEIVRCHFTSREQAMLEMQVDDALAFQRCFLAIWTRKEACLKAIGRGLTFPLAKVHCGAEKRIEAVVIEDDRLQAGAIDIDDAYVGSWAQAHRPPLSYHSGDERDLSSQPVLG